MKMALVPPSKLSISQNEILAALTSEDYARLLPELELIPMPLGMVVCDSGEIPQYAYFPVTSIVSILYVLENDASAEIALTGFDGFVGIALFMGGDKSPWKAVVQSAGVGYRIKASTLRREFRLSSDLRRLALIFIQTLITQMAQTAVCNRHHSVVEQLCRWLLLSLDRLPSNHLKMTQGLIANMLGVRRVGVTEAAGKLQAEGLIQYSRGNILILDRPGLEKRVCECYAVVKKEAERLQPYRTSHPARVGSTNSPFIRRANHMHTSE